MSFEDTTREMADEVARMAAKVIADGEWRCRQMFEPSAQTAHEAIVDLAKAVVELARCVARRFPGDPDETP